MPIYQPEHTAELQEIITAVPSWIVRWGSALVILVLGGLVLLSTTIAYPDVVKAKLVVRSLNGSSAIRAIQGTKLTTILATDGANVEKNQVVAYLESRDYPKDGPKYVLRAPISGKLRYSGIIQLGQDFDADQEIFTISTSSAEFFGEIEIPQYNMGKINTGQRTLVKLHSYPFEQYGLISGKLIYISDVAYRDSVFIAKTSFDKFENKDNMRKIILKSGMRADAEIITAESTLLQRFIKSIRKMNE